MHTQSLLSLVTPLYKNARHISNLVKMRPCIVLTFTLAAMVTPSLLAASLAAARRAISASPLTVASSSATDSSHRSSTSTWRTVKANQSSGNIKGHNKGRRDGVSNSALPENPNSTKGFRACIWSGTVGSAVSPAMTSMPICDWRCS